MGNEGIMSRPKRTTVTVPRNTYAEIEEVARRRNRKVPAVIVELASEGARREVAAARRREAFQKGLAVVFGGMAPGQVRALSGRLRASLDR